VLGGVATDYCVDATARSALSHGFDVDLLDDGHTTLDDETGLAASQIIAHHNAVLAASTHPGGRLRLIASEAAFVGKAH
jgi:nicotinamidase-related amidase